MPIIKKRLVTLICGTCKKEVSTVIENNEEAKPIEDFYGWIEEYNISGKMSFRSSDDVESFCSVNCLHKAIDQYFNGFKNINK